MFPEIRSSIEPNTLAFETLPLLKPTGFREYDGRWLFGSEINLMGAQALGLGLATLMREMGVRPEIVVGHDFRSYSASIKMALATGLIAGGVSVHDIGLALTPTAYFAQYALDVPGVAMVTASHNENGWTGVKMGVEPPLTFGPQEMQRLSDIVFSGDLPTRDGGGYRIVSGMAERYLDDLLARPKIGRKLKVVVACGNGTAGAFAPKALAALGCEVVPLDCELDYGFPRYNPNPEDLTMLGAMREAVLLHGADLAFGFDGDGDRCGVVDERGEPVFADKLGLLLARDLAASHPQARFVVDVKSTGLYASDPVLRERGATTDYWKTGHSHIKRRAREIGALAAFERSGHYFFSPPLGRGYDDALLSAFTICDLLDHEPEKSLSELVSALPKTWSSPTMSPHCADEAKYGVVDEVAAIFEARFARGEPMAGSAIREVNTVNGVRVTTADGAWGLVRASSNKPELVVVVESPVSEAGMRAMFEEIDSVLRSQPQVGAYNQTLPSHARQARADAEALPV